MVGLNFELLQTVMFLVGLISHTLVTIFMRRWKRVLKLITQ